MCSIMCLILFSWMNEDVNRGFYSLCFEVLNVLCTFPWLNVVGVKRLVLLNAWSVYLEEYMGKLFLTMSNEICLRVETLCVSSAITSNGTMVEDLWFVSLLYRSMGKSLTLFSYLIFNIVLLDCHANIWSLANTSSSYGIQCWVWGVSWYPGLTGLMVYVNIYFFLKF